MQKQSIAICGCGISGLTLGILLCRQGHEVVAYDQFDSPKPVGSGFLLQPTGLAVLDALGLLDEVEKHGCVHELNGLAIQRNAVFDALYAAGQAAGMTFHAGKTITSSELRGTQRRIVFADGTRTEPYDLVIDAMGQRSVLRPKQSTLLRYGALWASLDWPEGSGFTTNAGEQRYFKSSKMIGIVPIGTSQVSSTPKMAFFWSIKDDEVAAWRDTPLSVWKDEVTALWPETSQILDQVSNHDDLTFAQYRHSTLSAPVAPALAHIGDSYHATSPQLGQGANMALLDAYALAQGLEKADTLDSAFDHYIWARALHVRLFQSMSWAFTPIYQSDSAALPFLRDNILAPLVKLPMGGLQENARFAEISG